MKKAWAGNNESAEATRKAACFGIEGWVVSIHRKSCAMMQGMVPCLPFSEYDWTKECGI
jgi:hypothetical protein